MRENWPSTKKPRRRRATGVENEVGVLEMVNENRRCSQRTIAATVDVSKTSVQRILSTHKFHVYHLILVQELKPTDYPKRLALCNFF